MLSDMGISEGVPCWEHIGHPITSLTNTQAHFSHDWAEPCFHTGALQLASSSATSSQRRCDHCRPLSCHHTLLDCCRNYSWRSDGRVVGHMSTGIYSTWWLPALPRNQYVATCALWLHNGSKRCSVGVHADNKSETTRQLIFIWVQYFLSEMFTCSTCAFKERQRLLKQSKCSAESDSSETHTS